MLNLQLRKQVADVTDKQRNAEHEREVAEQKVLEVCIRYLAIYSPLHVEVSIL